MITRTASEIAEICGATLEGDGSVQLVGPASLRDARGDQISFLGNPQYKPDLESTGAGAVLLATDLAVERGDLALLRCDNPNRAFSRVVEAFLPADERPEAGVHPSAVVAPGAELGEGVSIGPLCSVGAGAVLGAGVVLHAGVQVGPGVRIGAQTEVQGGCVLQARAEIGERCLIGAGTVIGSEGFGFEPTREGWVKIPQCGTVVIGDEVETGANCTIDRARFGATTIGAGAKLDNMVHLAHNVQVGEGALLIAQVAISGSSRVGKHAILAGQVGVAGHLTIGDGARIGAQSGLGEDIPAGEDWFGSPARPKIQSVRSWVALGKLPAMMKEFKALQRRVGELESQTKDREETP